MGAKRIFVADDGIAAVASALAVAQGHEVVRTRDACDMVVCEATSPDELTGAASGPVLAIVPRRLRSGEAKRFVEAGATAVLGTDASVLDLAFAYADLLFESLCAQRRHARAHGGAGVLFRPVGSAEGVDGRLVGIARAGTYLLTDALEAPGTPIEMTLTLAGQPVRFLGRVACQAGREDRRGFGVEFALDSHDVAPRLADVSRRIVRPARSASGQHAPA